MAALKSDSGRHWVSTLQRVKILAGTDKMIVLKEVNIDREIGNTAKMLYFTVSHDVIFL